MAATAAAESVLVSPAVRSLGKIFKGGADGGVDGGGVDGGVDGGVGGVDGGVGGGVGGVDGIEPTTLSGQSATLIRTHSIPTGLC